MGKKEADVKKKPQPADETNKKEKASAPEEQDGAATEEAVEEETEGSEAEETKEQEETGENETAESEETEEPEEAEPESGEEEPEDGADEKAVGEKKKLFPKREKKDKKEEKIDELKDRVTRQMAEFENFRKRTEREKSQMFETGARSIIEKILPVIDNFERGLSAVPEEEKDSPFVDGMDKIYKQLLTELENAGVTVIEAVGQEFDPELHNAVMQVESEEYESGVVAQELQKGYKYRDTVVRHSMVAVVQ